MSQGQQSGDLQKKISVPKGPMGTPKKSSFESNVERIRVDSEDDIEKIYQIGDVLGRGAFGVVKEVVLKESREKFAMKIVAKDKPGSVSIQLLEREVEVLKRVNHPNIIRVEAVYETAKKMYIVMELCAGGELSDELKKRTYFREEEAKDLMRRIVEAVVYMHDIDMVHRDLKLENVLLANNDPKDFTIKVTDFGLANMKGVPGCEDLMHSKCGTPYYMAPEVLYTKHEYTKMCDVWSLGVIMYSLMCGKYPFQSNNPLKLEELILKGELTFAEIEWINVGDGAKALIKNMLCVDTTNRFTARRILDDPWFTGQQGKKMMNALDLMRDIMSTDIGEGETSIVVSSPSDVFLTSHHQTSQTASPPSTTTATTTTSSSNPSSPPHTATGSKDKSKQRHGTPTKKSARKTRTLSSSALPGVPGGKGPGNLQSSSAVTSPTHRPSLSSSSSVGSPVASSGGSSGGGSGGSAGPRARVITFSASGAKSQVLSPPGPSPKSSVESMQSSSSKEKRLAMSPTRTSRISRTNNNNT